MKIVSQQYRAWSDCTDVQSCLALYWWQRLNTFGVGRIRVKGEYVFQVRCQNEGGYLTAINSEAEENFLKQQAKQVRNAGPYKYVIIIEYILYCRNNSFFFS